MKVVFATILLKEDDAISLNRVDARDRLLSFYELSQLPPDHLQKYVTNGTIYDGTVKARNTNWKSSAYILARKRSLIRRSRGYDDLGEMTPQIRNPGDRREDRKNRTS